MQQKACTNQLSVCRGMPGKAAKVSIKNKFIEELY